MPSAYLQRSVAHSRLFAVLIAAVILAGCRTPSPTVIEDAHVASASLRLAINLNGGEKAAAEQQTGHAIVLGVVKAKGGGEQASSAGQAAQPGRNDFNMNYSDISWRWRKFFRERSIGLELAGGVGRLSLGLKSHQYSTHSYLEYGPQGGIALIWRMQPESSLHARASVFINDTALINRQELFYEQALGQNIALRAGYARWKMTEQIGLFEGDIWQISFSGPTLDLGVSF